MNPKIKDDLLTHINFISKQLEDSQFKLRLALNRLQLIEQFLSDMTRYETLIEGKVGVLTEPKMPEGQK